MVALLKEWIGFHFLPSGFGKANPCFPFAVEGLCDAIELLSARDLDSPSVDFKSFDALSFYETAEIGSLRAVRVCYRTIVRIVIHFFIILPSFAK